MIDRKYLLALLLLLIILTRGQILAPLIALVTILLPTWLIFAIFEAVASFVAPHLQRDLINFRLKPDRVTPRLVRHLGLDAPQPQSALAEKATALAKAAQAVTLRHPNPITGPVALDRLTQALDAVLPPANKGFTGELQKAWLNPVPGLGSIGGLILMVRQTLGRLLFPRASADADVSATAWLFLRNSGRNLNAPKGMAWKMANYDSAALYDIRTTFALPAGFHPATAKSHLLPLRAQRILGAAAAALHGSPQQARLARLANPSHSRLLKTLAEDAQKWRQWIGAQDAAAAAKQAAPDYRAKDSLTEAEITALIADRAQDSILLNRIWPPGTPATGNSWLGGLPCLPSDMDWPRSSQTKLPLHFLAQVDCADLPTMNGTSPLPRGGLLLFFTDLDEERIDEDDERRHAVVYVPQSKQHVPPRALPDDLPEIDHADGQPSSYTDAPAQRHYPKWPVTAQVVKTWAGEEADDPKTRSINYLEQARAVHDASLEALMPPRAVSNRLSDIFPYQQRKDADGKTILTAEGKAIPYTVFDPAALPSGFPWCGAGIDAFVTRLQQQAIKATRNATSARTLIDAKWNDTEDKRARKRAEAEKAEATAAALDQLAAKARKALGTVPALTPISADTLQHLHHWFASIAAQTPEHRQTIHRAVSDSILTLTRAAVTDADLLALLPTAAFEIHATSLIPSPRQSQHLMLGPAQTKTNSTALSGIRLLCLDSDYGLGMMYCDCGVLEYWIKPEDLAALRFDRATAATAGG